MKLKIKKAFGIKNELVIDSNKRNLIIFAPNGVGKSSIAKTFRQIVKEEIDKFGQEEHGGKESLILDGINMEKLQEKNFLILTNEELQTSNLTNDPVKNYLEKNIITKKFKEIFTSFNDLINNISEEYSFDFKNKPKNQDLHFLFELKQIRDEEKQKILNTIHSLSEGGHFERIDQTKQELEILYKEYDLINETRKILIKHKKRINLKQIMEIIEKEGKERGYKKELLDVLNIIRFIIDKKLSTKFGYRDNNKEPFQQVGDIIFERIMNEISKKGLNSEEIKLVLKGASLFDKYNISKKNKTIPSRKIKLIDDKIENKENEHIVNIFDKYSSQLFQIKRSIKKNLDEYVIKYNEQVVKINKFLNNKEERIWKFEVEKIEIETVFDEIKIKYTQYNKKRKWEQLNNFASTGQLKIIAIGLKLLEWKDYDYDYIIIDDIISSLDIDNSDLVINTILDIDTDIILMTHNFALINKMAFKKDFTKKFDLFILDRINEKETFSLQANWRHIENIPSLIKEENKIEVLKMSRLSMLSGVLYEYINNYIDLEKKKVNNNSLSSKYLESIKEVINLFSRHWKNINEKIFIFSKKLKNPVKLEENSKEYEKYKNYRAILFNQYSVFKELLNIDGDDNFLNYFTNFDLSEIMDKIDKMELIDWISLKYRITMTIRYKIEKFIVSKNSKLKDDWCSNKVKVLRRLTIVDYLKDKVNDDIKYLLNLNKRLNFINHLDNLKWVPLFEFPMYKLIKFLDLTIEKTK